MTRRIALTALAASLLTLAGCGPKEGGATATTGGPATAKGSGLKVGMVFDSGGRGDKSFNDSAYAGLLKAQKELGVEIQTVDSKAVKDYQGNLETLADGGFDLIIAVGITQKDALARVAPKYPKVKFAVVDADLDAPNVRGLLFAEEQGSYLAGVAAGLATKTDKIGFVGGMSIPLIKKFEAGYFAGAKSVNPRVQALPSKYTESWNDANIGKASAAVLFAGGADVVYHAAGRCGLGVIQAAKEAGKLAIGVDSDQDAVAPGFVLTSMVKRVDKAVFATIKDLKDGKFQGGKAVYDLKDDGVGLTDFKYTKDKISPKGMGMINMARAAIIAGKVTVPTQ